MNNETQAWAKFKLRIDDVNGRNCLTNFHGMTMTSDKHRSLIRKWQTLIEANIDVRTTDGYLLRLFAIGFTARRPNQIKKTTYAQTSQVKAIRKKMFEILTREASTCDLQAFVAKLYVDFAFLLHLFSLFSLLFCCIPTLRTPYIPLRKL